MAGVEAAVEYLASLGPRAGLVSEAAGLRARLEAGYRAIAAHEAEISRLFLALAASVSGLRVHGVTSPADLHRRTPTFCVTQRGLSAPQLAEQLVARGVAAGAGHFYALQFPDRMGLKVNTNIV